MSEVGLIDLLIVSVGAARGREKLRAMGDAQDRGHGPLLHFNQLNPPPECRAQSGAPGLQFVALSPPPPAFVLFPTQDFRQLLLKSAR